MCKSSSDRSLWQPSIHTSKWVSSCRFQRVLAVPRTERDHGQEKQTVVGSRGCGSLRPNGRTSPARAERQQRARQAALRLQGTGESARPRERRPTPASRGVRFAGQDESEVSTLDIRIQWNHRNLPPIMACSAIVTYGSEKGYHRLPRKLSGLI